VLDSALYFLAADTAVPFFPNNVYVTNGFVPERVRSHHLSITTSTTQNLKAIGSKLFVSLNDLRSDKSLFIIDPSQIRHHLTDAERRPLRS